jgi:archaemetzincin
MPLSVIPESARRKHPTVGNDQILTTYVLNKVLKPALPRDAAASIALTATDLWPGEGWNFVFGQASLSDRVGVWSINRSGNPDDSDEAFRLCLLRAMKVATHETAHMFTIQHCTKYECNMCGSNSQRETDRRLVEVCPECVAKICWATGCDPAARFRKLAEFCREQKLETEQKFYEKSLEAVTAKPAAK